LAIKVLGTCIVEVTTMIIPIDVVGIYIETNLWFDFEMVFKTQMAENLAKINIFHNHKNPKTNVKMTYWNWGGFDYQIHSCFIFWFDTHVWKNQPLSWAWLCNFHDLLNLIWNHAIFSTRFIIFCKVVVCSSFVLTFMNF
jgi:hypothetical protein